jgi:ribosomal protein S18 acetylase RimI-like enzyme
MAVPHVIRPYQPQDRAAIRRICADTGFLGKPIDPVFEDRELFADYLINYYLDAEPDLTFICELDGVVKGYVMGSRFPKLKSRYEARHLPLLALRGTWRCFTRPYNAASRRYIRWILTQARREVPPAPPDMPHMHFNILPEGRSVAATRELLDNFFARLREGGETKVYGQVVSYGVRRGVRMFERYGFRVVDQREVTKYRAFYPERVELFTVVKDLLLNAHTYGTDLHKWDLDREP